MLPELTDTTFHETPFTSYQVSTTDMTILIRAFLPLWFTKRKNWLEQVIVTETAARSDASRLV
jgi:hypothetical protein